MKWLGKLLFGSIIWGFFSMSVFCEKIPVNMVRITGRLEILTTEVTQKLYESVMGENPSKFKGADNPVENVSFYDAIYFCNKLSLMNGLEPVYYVNGSTDVTVWNYTPHKGEDFSVKNFPSCNGYRLPNEEEWFFAARGINDGNYGSEQDFTYSGSNNIDEVAWYNKNSNGKTHPVAQKKANSFGLYDMSGNVWEWYDDRFYGRVRFYGGGFFSTDYDCKLNYEELKTRSAYTYNFKSESIGFRIVRTVEEIDTYLP